MALRTGLITSARYLEHDTGAQHPERPARLRAIAEHFRERGIMEAVRVVAPLPAELDMVQRVHEAEYVERFREACAQGLGSIDTPECPVSTATYEIALLAAGAGVAAADEVMARRLRNAFCPVRPPGHHAECGFAMGFCYFNNVAIAAEHLRARYGLKRIAILDWDVHHCNGTQHHFECDADVLVCSIHQHPYTLFPGTGFEYEKGAGEGVGATLNVPMMPGSGETDYRKAFEAQIMPAIAAFRPEFLLVSAGFDAHYQDPLGEIELSTGAFAWMSQQARTLAETLCGGRMVSLLEGGYHLEMLAECARVHVEQMAGLVPEAD
jgi:acetoin utilization deacetylase AcuC-like enzyme